MIGYCKFHKLYRFVSNCVMFRIILNICYYYCILTYAIITVFCLGNITKLFLLFVNFNLLVFCLFMCCYGTRLVLLIFWALLFIIPSDPTKSSIQRIKMNIQYVST